MITTLEIKPVTLKVISKEPTSESEEIKKNIDNHKMAAKHLELAAEYHLEASKYLELGNYYEAEQSSFIAQGHYTLAGQCKCETPASLFNW